MMSRKPTTKPAAKPVSKPSTTPAPKRATTASPAAKPPATTRPKAASAAPPPGMTRRTAGPAATTTARKVAPSRGTQVKTAPAAGARPASGAGRAPLGGLGYRPASTSRSPPSQQHTASVARTALEDLADHYDSQPPSARRAADRGGGGGGGGGDGDDHDNDVARHADLDDMSPSFKDLVAMRERQHGRVRDVLVRYNDELQKRIETSVPRTSSYSPNRDRSHSMSPGGAAGGAGGAAGADGSLTRNRTMSQIGGPNATVATADEAKIIEELLAEETAGGSADAEDGESKPAATAEEGGETKPGGAEGDNSKPAAATGADGTDSGATKIDTPRAGAGASPVTVTRTALRAIIKHAQTTVNTAIDEDRERREDFENAVVDRLCALEAGLDSVRTAMKQDKASAAEAEEQNRTARASDLEELRGDLQKLSDWSESKEAADAEKAQGTSHRINDVAARLADLLNTVDAHQKDLEARTRTAAQEFTQKAVDDAAARIHDLSEMVQDGLSASERCRDDIPQAIVAGMENVETSLNRALASEFEAQNMRITVAEEHQSSVNKANREQLASDVEAMKTDVGATLGDLREKYDGAVQQHVDDVRAKAEEYEEARRSALPLPDKDRVRLMNEELENSLNMLKYLTEASSTAMTSTIPPRVERNEQKTAQIEAAVESQQDELNRLRHSNVRFDVSVGPDNLKEAWLGVSQYRAAPPPLDFEGNPITDPEAAAAARENDEDNMQAVHDQINEALRLIAHRTASMSPLRKGQQSSPAGAAAGAAASATSPNTSSSSGRGGGLTGSGSGGHDVEHENVSLPSDFHSLPAREQMAALAAAISGKRAALIKVQRALTNIQHAFHELTMREAEIVAAASPPGAGTSPRSIAAYQANRKVCDEIADRKQRMFERERAIVEKRNRLSRDVEMLTLQENEVLRQLAIANANSGSANVITSPTPGQPEY